MTDTPQINPAIGALFRQYRKQKLNPRTGKSWTLHELSTVLAALFQQAFQDPQAEGLSPSAISRLENGSLLPGRAKLRIMADFLEIPEPELKPLIDLGDAKAPPVGGDLHVQGRVQELENKLQKTPLDWLKLLSASNLAGFYYQSLGWAEDSLLVTESPHLPPAVQTVLRALIQSKKAYAHFCLEPEAEVHLQRSREWARHADQALPLVPHAALSVWDLAWLQIETVRCLTTATLEIFNTRFLKHPRFNSAEVEALAQSRDELEAIFRRFEQTLTLEHLAQTGEHQQELTELYLYLMREKDRLHFKWLEAMEMQLLWQDPLVQTALGPHASVPLERMALCFYERLSAQPEQTCQELEQFYHTDASGQLLLRPAQALQAQWRALSQSMLNTLDQHDRLHEPHPNKAWQEAVMLYPLTAARLGQFDRFVDLGYLKLLYMQTNAQTRPLWHYVRACCYALLYRSSARRAHLETSLENWFHYCFAEPDGRCNLEQFSHCLHELALWSTWWPLLKQTCFQPEDTYQQWFVITFEQLLKQPRIQRLRTQV